jgi:hypothetical protein
MINYGDDSLPEIARFSNALDATNNMTMLIGVGRAPVRRSANRLRRTSGLAAFSARRLATAVGRAPDWDRTLERGALVFETASAARSRRRDASEPLIKVSASRRRSSGGRRRASILSRPVAEQARFARRSLGQDAQEEATSFAAFCSPAGSGAGGGSWSRGASSEALDAMSGAATTAHRCDRLSQLARPDAASSGHNSASPPAPSVRRRPGRDHRAACRCAIALEHQQLDECLCTKVN